MSSSLDTMTAEEQRLLSQMQADDAATEGQDQAPQLPPIEPQQQPAQQQPTAEPQPGTEAGDKHTGMVERRALDEERTRRRELQQRLAEVERTSAAAQARVEERLRLLSEAAQTHLQQQQAAQAPPAAAAPDFATDPAGFIRHGFEQIAQQNQTLMQRLQQLEQGNVQITQAQREQAAVADLGNWAQAQEHEFARDHQDYMQASAYLQSARERMIRAMGVQDPAEVRAQLTNDVRSLAVMSRERGQQFGRVLYDLAVAHGYQPQNGAQGLQQGAQQGGQQAQSQALLPAAMQTRPQADTAAERLVRGQEMATTIGATGGAARGEPTATAIANMSDAEFSRYVDQVQKLGPAAMRALFGE